MSRRPVIAAGLAALATLAGAIPIAGCSDGSHDTSTVVPPPAVVAGGQLVDGAIVDASGAPARIYVDTAGDPARPALVFFHALARGRAQWEPQLSSSLASRWFLVRVDARGHGRSDKPVDAIEYQTGRKWADDVNAVLSTFHLKRPILVASGFGATSTLLYLQAYGAANVGGVVFVGPDVPSERTAALQALLSGPNGLVSTSADTNIGAVTSYLVQSRFNPRSEAELQQTIGAVMECPVYARSLIVQADTLRNFPSIYRTITLPALIIQGTNDRLENAPTALGTVASYMPQAKQLIYDNCGFECNSDQPDRFNSDLDSFASQVFGASR